MSVTMDKSSKVTIRVEPELRAEIEDCLAAERRQGREMSVAAFIRMAVRRTVREEKQRLKPESKS